GCTQKTDLVLESQDGVRFGAHSANLAAFSDAFPVVDSGINANEVVQMTERADVVLLLLQLTHRQRWMRSDKIPFGLLHRLAEAAEKFFIPAIMEMCRIQMETVASKHPLEVFIYACKHSYDDIRDAAAPGTLDLPFESTLRRLSAYPSTCISWVCTYSFSAEDEIFTYIIRSRSAIVMWRHLCNSIVVTRILSTTSAFIGKSFGVDLSCL
ncbi:hypothetical protein GGU10DRAFT_262733, partial [Lentinula aff. detonsa]